MGKLTAHFKGGFSVEYQKTLDWFEILEWEKVYKRQQTENQVVYDLGHDKDGKTIKLPSNETIREEVDRRLKEDEENIEEKLKEYGRRK